MWPAKKKKLRRTHNASTAGHIRRLAGHLVPYAHADALPAAAHPVPHKQQKPSTMCQSHQLIAGEPYHTADHTADWQTLTEGFGYLAPPSGGLAGSEILPVDTVYGSEDQEDGSMPPNVDASPDDRLASTSSPPPHARASHPLSSTSPSYLDPAAPPEERHSDATSYYCYRAGAAMSVAQPDSLDGSSSIFTKPPISEDDTRRSTVTQSDFPYWPHMGTGSLEPAWEDPLSVPLNPDYVGQWTMHAVGPPIGESGVHLLYESMDDGQGLDSHDRVRA